jgi:Mre11 DNA-binding presumed domain.
LHYLFEKGKVHFAEPPGNDYMNILILHQNRFKGIRPGVPYKNCIHTNMLPDFFDLIIWGNEHEASDELTEDPVKNFYVYQPGSSIATSLNAGEALPKHVGFFEIYEKKNFRFVPIKLRNQRPLYVKNIELESLLDNKNVKRSKRLDFDDDNEDREKEIVQKLEEEVAQLLEEHEKKYALERKMKVPPLIRIKVEYTGFDIIRIKQLESKFLGKVANEG